MGSISFDECFVSVDEMSSNNDGLIDGAAIGSIFALASRQ